MVTSAAAVNVTSLRWEVSVTWPAAALIVFCSTRLPPLLAAESPANRSTVPLPLVETGPVTVSWPSIVAMLIAAPTFVAPISVRAPPATVS